MEYETGPKEDKNRERGMENTERLRLTAREEAVYRDLAEGLPVDAPEALDRLRRLGLVRDIGGRPVALDPRVTAQQLLTGYHGSLARTLQQMSQVIYLEGLARHYDPQRLFGGPASELIETREQMNDRIGHALTHADGELLTVQPGVPSERHPAILQAGIERARAVLDRGMQVRSMYPSAALTHAPTREYVNFVIEGGGAVRVGRELPPRMVVAGRFDLFAENHVTEGDTDSGWHIQDIACVSFARTIFDSYWVRATPWQEASAALSDVATTPRQRMILRGLAEGETQRTVANRLELSNREVGRELEALREGLGLRSTNQLMVWWATSLDREVP
ncbi:hypothetical protein ACIQCR_24505 [Streptomyces sp. NPDC093249]|uniref:hypothetical protein n=1 Tax=unclassified Streptomyces TaxID=2593676 RepID=UPI0038279F5C